MKNLKSTRTFASLLIGILMLTSQSIFSQATVNLDPTFNSGSGFDWYVYKVILQPDGKILAFGDYGFPFTTYNGVPVDGLVRLNTDGTLDTSFHLLSKLFDSAFVYVSSISFQANGKILVGGGFSSYMGIPCKNFVRLNSDYSYDTTFHQGTGFIGPGGIGAIFNRNDGKMLVMGGFTSYNGTPSDGAIVLNADGTIGPAFNMGVGVPSTAVGQTINCYYMQSDKKLLVGGIFSAWNGIPANNLVRIDTLGQLDNSLTSSNFNGDIYSVHQQPDGKIIVCGLFSTISGTSRSKIGRLNSNGTLDFSFNTGTGFQYGGSSVNSDARNILLQPDGKIIVSGKFDSYNGHPASALARLNSDGSFDTTFKVGLGFHSSSGMEAVSLCRQADGKLITFGYFYDFNTASCGNIARLDGPALTISIEENKAFLPSFNLFPNPAITAITADVNEAHNKPYSLTVTDALGKRVKQDIFEGTTASIDLAGLSRGVYFVTLQSEGERAIRRFVKE